MMNNPCLRPATWRDALPLMNRDFYGMFPERLARSHETGKALQDLYDAEWKLRGFEGSP